MGIRIDIIYELQRAAVIGHNLLGQGYRNQVGKSLTEFISRDSALAISGSSLGIWISSWNIRLCVM